VEYALAGMNGVMPVIRGCPMRPIAGRSSRRRCRIANHEKKMPAGFIRKDGYGITAACRRYLAPLVRGEAPLAWAPDGLPAYVLPDALVPRRLPGF
jgi:6-phosphofructokinase 1